jgi:ankyrin repeat protein
MSSTGDRAPTAVKFGIAVFATLLLGLFALIVFSVGRRANSPCPLCDAVDTNDPAQVRTALEDGAPIDDRAWQIAVINLSNSNGGVPEIAIARLLVERGADPNASWSVGGSTSTRSTVQRGASKTWASTVLAQASAEPSLVDAMLAHGLEVRGVAAAEALIAAAVLERTAVVLSLLRAGVPPNRQDGEGGPSALAYAIQTRNLELIGALEAGGGREW